MNKIQQRYKIGQTVNMRQRNDDGKILKRFKVKILGFYPNFVLTERKGFKECFTYWGFEQLTAIKKGEAA